MLNPQFHNPLIWLPALTIMHLNCSECYESLHNSYLAIISAYKKSTAIEEGPGLGICSSHLEDKIGELRERYQQHQLYILSDGLLFLLDVAESITNPDGTIKPDAKTQRQGIVGYLVTEEMKKYLPLTIELLTSRLKELRIFADAG